MKFYINELKDVRNFKNIPELKIVQKNMLSIINFTNETTNRFDPLLIVELWLIF